MKEIDPGHVYKLAELDGGEGQTLIYVKRKGTKYPSNQNAHSGTTMQEVLRTVVHRLKYVQNQIPDEKNIFAQQAIEKAIFYLEWRAAVRHNRPCPSSEEAVYGPFCSKCNHAGCNGGCH